MSIIAQTPLDLVLSRLRGVRQIGEGKHQALCPAHDDHNASLAVTEVTPGGKVLLHCHANCEFPDILHALGLEAKDLFPQGEPAPKPQIVKTYDYVDEKGVLLFQSVRFVPKDFRQRRPIIQGHYAWTLAGGWFEPDDYGGYRLIKGADDKTVKPNLAAAWRDPIRTVLYHLPEVLAAVKAGGTILVVEGEKDADNLRSELGLTVTTNPMGAGKWRNHYSETLRGANIVVIPDKDTAGRKHAQDVAKSLQGKAANIKVMELPDRGEKNVKDASDWIAAGGTADELTVLAKAVSEWQPTEEAPGSEPDILHGTIAGMVNLTDLGNGRRLAARHSRDLRYCRPWKTWFVWDGTRWKADETGEVEVRAKETIAAMYAEASEIIDSKERENLVRHALSSERGSRIREMITLAASEPGIPVTPHELDRDPWLLNVENGTLDLRTGELLPHRREDLITKLGPVRYDPEARLPMWDRFLEDATGKDRDLAAFLQRAIGYSLTGKTSEEVLFFVHGPTNTGKSTLLEAIKATLGDYAATADFETFLARSFVGSPRDDVATLEGARFVASIEVDEGQRLAVGLTKLITGGDSVTARRLYQKTSTFLPTLKLWLAANHAPKVSSEDAALWRRIIRVPFEHIVPKDKRNPHVKETLRDPAIGGPAILAWAVQGCLAWRSQGLAVPTLVEKATDDYKTSQDLIGAFLKECCKAVPETVPEDLIRTEVSSVYSAYVKWSVESGEKPLAVNKFSQKVSERGFQKERTNRVRYFAGLILADGDAPEESAESAPKDQPLRPEAALAGQEVVAAPREPF